MRDRDRDPPRPLLRRLVDLIERRKRRRRILIVQHLRDRRRQRRLPMVNMTNRPNVQMRLVPLELLLRHRDSPSSRLVVCVLRWWSVGAGSGGGTRTRDPTIMSRVLLPTELHRQAGPARAGPRSPLTDSNRRPLPYHGSALPTELRGQPAQDSGRPRRATVPGPWTCTCAWPSGATRSHPLDLQPRGARVDRHLRPRSAHASTSRSRGSTSTPAATRRSWPSDAAGEVVGFGSLSARTDRGRRTRPTVEDSVYVHRDRRGERHRPARCSRSWSGWARRTASTR